MVHQGACYEVRGLLICCCCCDGVTFAAPAEAAASASSPNPRFLNESGAMRFLLMNRKGQRTHSSRDAILGSRHNIASFGSFRGGATHRWMWTNGEEDVLHLTATTDAAGCGVSDSDQE